MAAARSMSPMVGQTSRRALASENDCAIPVAKRFRRSAGPAVEHQLALDLVQAAPNPMGLADADGVLQTVPPHMALMTNLFGPELTGGFLFLPFSVRRREERRRLRSPAGCFYLPRV